MSRGLFIIFLLHFSSWALSAMELKINQQDFQASVIENSYLYEDTSHQLTIEDILTTEYTNKFSPTHNNQLSIKKGDSNYWLKLKLNNQLTELTPVILTLNQRQSNDVELWIISARKIQKVTQQSSIVLPLFTRGLSNTIFQLNIPAQQSLNIVIKANSSTPNSMFIDAHSALAFANDKNMHRWISGLCFGLVFTLMVYSIFMSLTTRELSYSLFAIMSTAMLFNQGAWQGYFLDSPLAGILATKNVILTTFYLLATTIFLFARSYLSNLRNNKGFQGIVNCMALLGLLGTIFIFVIPEQVQFPITSIYILLCTLITFLASLYSYGKGFKPSLYFALAMGILFIATLVTVLSTLALIPVNKSLMVILMLSSSIFILVTAIGLSTRNYVSRNLVNENNKQVAIAEATARTRSEFINRLSNELRTPMSGILGMSELLLDSNLTSSQRDFILTIQSSGHELMTAINDMTDISKIEDMDRAPDELTFDISATVAECLEIFREKAEERGLELISNIQPSIPSLVIGDETRIRQILLSLLNNAFKFTHKGEVLVTLSRAKNERISITVTDTGSGLGEQEQKDIFDIQTSTSRGNTQHHLGLAVARQLVQSLEGDIGVRSQLGRGSNFWFTVPVTYSIQSQLTPNSDIGEKLKGLNLLVVDDNASCRKIVEQQANSWAMNVVVTLSAKEALATLRSRATLDQHVDIAIIDNDMPEMSGLELAAKIKADPVVSKDCMLILMTGAHIAPTSTEARNAGIRRVLTKPVSSRTLKITLAEELGLIESSIESNHEFDDANTLSERRLRVLVAEDNTISTRVINGMLSKLGVFSDSVENGQKAFEALLKQKYDLVLMDCEMPIMDGFEATRTIRNWEHDNSKSETPIIALTAHIRDEHKEKSLQAGMNAHMTKPVELNQLQEILERWALTQSI